MFLTKLSLWNWTLRPTFGRGGNLYQLNIQNDFLHKIRYIYHIMFMLLSLNKFHIGRIILENEAKPNIQGELPRSQIIWANFIIRHLSHLNSKNIPRNIPRNILKIFQIPVGFSKKVSQKISNFVKYTKNFRIFLEYS